MGGGREGRYTARGRGQDGSVGQDGNSSQLYLPRDRISDKRQYGSHLLILTQMGQHGRTHRYLIRTDLNIISLDGRDR